MFLDIDGRKVLQFSTYHQSNYGRFNHEKSDDQSKQLPLIHNFAARLFDPSSRALLKATASYLTLHGVSFDPRLLDALGT